MDASLPPPKSRYSREGRLALLAFLAFLAMTLEGKWLVRRSKGAEDFIEICMVEALALVFAASILVLFARRVRRRREEPLHWFAWTILGLVMAVYVTEPLAWFGGLLVMSAPP